MRGLHRGLTLGDCSSQSVSVQELMPFLPIEQSAVGAKLHPPEHVAAGTVMPAETLV